MLLLLLNYVVLRALWKIDVHLISTLVNKKSRVAKCSPMLCIFNGEASCKIGTFSTSSKQPRQSVDLSLFYD